MCGVYMIRCRENGWYYIGGTEMDFEVRFGRHRSMLQCGKAPRLLQACYDLHGEQGFDFVPLYPCAPAEVAAREREAIETLKPDLNVYGVRVARPRGLSGSASPRTYVVNGKEFTLDELEMTFGVGRETIRKRLKRGLTDTALIARPHAAPRKPYERRA